MQLSCPPITLGSKNFFKTLRYSPWHFVLGNQNLTGQQVGKQSQSDRQVEHHFTGGIAMTQIPSQIKLG